MDKEDQEKVMSLEGLVKMMVYKLNVPNEVREDLVQCGMIGAIDAVREHKPELGALTTFAAFKIKNRIFQEIKKSIKHDKCDSIDFDNQMHYNPDITGTIYIEQILKKYPKDHVAQLHLSSEGFSNQEIGEMYNVSKSLIQLRISNIREDITGVKTPTTKRGVKRKMTDEQLVNMKQKRKEGIGQYQLAAMFGISQAHVNYLLKKENA